VQEHRNVLAVPLFQRRVGIDVYDLDVEMKAGLQRSQARDHVIAQMAVGSAVDRERRVVRA
jgi:hypothetical protein